MEGGAGLRKLSFHPQPKSSKQSQARRKEYVPQDLKAVLSLWHELGTLKRPMTGGATTDQRGLLKLGILPRGHDKRTTVLISSKCCSIEVI